MRTTSLWQLGVLLGIYDLAEIVLKPVFGRISDRVGPKPVMIGGLVAFALASIVFVAGGQTRWLGAARLAQGAAAAAFSPAAVGYLPLLGARHHLTAVATGALVSLLAATAAVLQPWAGRAHDRATLPAARRRAACCWQPPGSSSL